MVRAANGFELFKLVSPPFWQALAGQVRRKPVEDMILAVEERGHVNEANGIASATSKSQKIKSPAAAVRMRPSFRLSDSRFIVAPTDDDWMISHFGIIRKEDY